MNTTRHAEARVRSRLLLAVLAVVVTAIVGTLDHQGVSSAAATSVGDLLGGDNHGGLGPADGVVPDSASVFDRTTPAVAKLDPRLLGALRRAAAEAAEDGVELRVNSGWRSPEYQAALLRDAVATYGSVDEAARWVSTPETSAHVAGDAVDIGPAAAADWLADHGDRYGLCQIYRNERWHYELRPAVASGGCPAMYADPTQDPRMRR